MERPKVDGHHVGELQVLLETPVWRLLRDEILWRDHDACESMRSCSPEELRKIQGRSAALREAANLPQTLIADWRQRNEGKQ